MSQQINLFNPAFVRRRKHFSLPAMLQGLVLVAAGSLAFYGYALYQVDQLEKQTGEIAKRYQAEQAQLARHTAEFSPQQAAQALQEEVRRLEKQLAEQAELLEVIKSGAIGNTGGYSEYMRAFSRQVAEGLWLTGFSITGDAAQISLSGAVLNPELLPAYIQRLSKESVMRGRTFATLQMRQPKVEGQGAIPRYVEFTLHSGPEGEARK
ncbi:PilN domain-containing protein [Candidatus Ferrigenium straubiae]|jgi:Flp pilus assembly protein TadB|uniref:PilN domain-containing protein n=1 Tax=Candidatus Ferrigenium straubiae TaxID=2919506 RepID=UPI003F4AA2AE